MEFKKDDIRLVLQTSLILVFLHFSRKEVEEGVLSICNRQGTARTVTQDGPLASPNELYKQLSYVPSDL